MGTPNGLEAFTPLLPTAAIAAPVSVLAEAPANFSAAGSSDPYPGGNVASYSWNWGDGSPTGNGVATTHTYTHAGEYAVRLTVTDSYGLVSLPVTQVVKVNGQAVNGSEGQGTARRKIEEEAAAHAAAVKRQEEEAARIQVLGIKEGSPDAAILGAPLRASAKGVVTIRISCPAADTRCSGTVTLRTLRAVSADMTIVSTAKPAVLTLGTDSFTVAGGKVATVALHLSAKVRALLERSHELRVRVTIVARDPAGETHTGQAITTLLAPKRTH